MLSLLQQVVHPGICDATATLIKRSNTPASVYRVTIRTRAGLKLPSTLIVKRVALDWPDDGYWDERETRFYNALLPGLGLAHTDIYYAGRQPDGDFNVIVMGDVAGTHRFLRPADAWRTAEMEPVMRAYAQLHVGGEGCLPPESERAWLLDRHETRVHAASAELPRMVEELVALDLWPPMPGFPRLLSWLQETGELLAHIPPTLLHNDVYPPNIALPLPSSRGSAKRPYWTALPRSAPVAESRPKPAFLLDWEMLGWGLGEMDLAFMFLQPYGADRALDKELVLDMYWAARAQLEGRLPSPDEREIRQRYAEALWAVWLVPVAHHVVHKPYPAGSSPGRYWDAMLPVLGQRLTMAMAM
jgi:hypothetical protein